jgi:SAM-dependent methyltransferase
MKEQWNERYAADHYIYGINPNVWFSEIIRHLKPGKILLPAEGEGRNAVFAAKCGWDVTAFDQSEAGRKKALKLAEISKVEISYLIDDLTSFVAPEWEFDAIALIFVHMPIEIRQTVHQRLLKFLKPGGHLILEAFTKDQLKNTSGGPKTDMLLYEKNFIANDFSEMEFIEFSETTSQLDEGPLHQGEAHVIRLFAKNPFIPNRSTL